MTVENTQQSEVPAEPQTTANDTTGQPSFEDIAKKYNIEEQTKTFTAKPETTPSQSFVDHRVPDPVINPDEFTKYQINQSAYVQKTLAEMAGTVQELRRAQEQERLNAEVNKAVARVNEKLKIDQKYAEILIEKEYRDNPAFQRIWNNRYMNPKALDEALDVIANNASGVFQVKSDPQLIENQRAAKASQKTMASSSNKTQNEDIINMSQSEFDKWWATQMGY